MLLNALHSLEKLPTILCSCYFCASQTGPHHHFSRGANPRRCPAAWVWEFVSVCSDKLCAGSLWGIPLHYSVCFLYFHQKCEPLYKYFKTRLAVNASTAGNKSVCSRFLIITLWTGCHGGGCPVWCLWCSRGFIEQWPATWTWAVRWNHSDLRLSNQKEGGVLTLG